MRFSRKSSLPILGILLVLTVSNLAAGTLPELFKSATATNKDYDIYMVDRELAELRKSKGEIEAKVELDRLSTESTYVAALADYRRSVLNFYYSVVDVAFTAASAELDALISALRVENAQVDVRFAESRFRSGLLSGEGLKDVEIALRTVTTDQELVKYNLEDALARFSAVVGLAWDSKLIPNVPAFNPTASAQQWIDKDTTLRRARLTEQLAAIRLANLPGNTALFDRRIQETELVKAQVAVANAENDARRAYEGIISRIRNQKALLQIRGDEYELRNATFQDALKRYEHGLISLSDRNQQQITLYTARKTLLQAQRTYIRTIGEYLVALDTDPMGL
jgi:outer membrane protein TolC